MNDMKRNEMSLIPSPPELCQLDSDAAGGRGEGGGEPSEEF